MVGHLDLGHISLDVILEKMQVNKKCDRTYQIQQRFLSRQYGQLARLHKREVLSRIWHR